MDPYRFLTRWDVLFTINFIFLITHLVIEQSRVEWKFARTLNSITNRYYSVLSALLFLYSCHIFWIQSELFSLPPLIDSACIQVPNSHQITAIFFLYYLSKFHEYIDIILVLLSCWPPIEYRLHPHFRYHHLTTPFFALVFLQYRCGHHAFFMLANLLMHTLVYWFHASPHHQTSLLFWICRIWGHVQLLLGISLSGYSLVKRFYFPGSEPCGTAMSDVVPLVLYTFYFILFQYQIYWPWPPHSSGL
jgi:hypothetical protein